MTPLLPPHTAAPAPPEPTASPSELLPAVEAHSTDLHFPSPVSIYEALMSSSFPEHALDALAEAPMPPTLLWVPRTIQPLFTDITVQILGLIEADSDQLTTTCPESPVPRRAWTLFRALPALLLRTPGKVRAKQGDAASLPLAAVL